MLKTLFGALILSMTLAGFFGLAWMQQAPLESAEVEVMISADRLVQNGHYEEAARMYQQLIAGGVRDASLYYNLGIATLQTGQQEEALIHFEEARAIDPRDPDIQTNLELARSLAGFPAPTTPTNPGIVALTTIRQSLTQNEIAVAMLALWFGLGFLLITRRNLARRLSGSWLVALALLPSVGLLVLGASFGLDLLPA